MGLFDSLRAVFSPDRDGVVRYQCRNCDRQFAYHADLTGPNCPYCDSDSLDPIADR